MEISITDQAFLNAFDHLNSYQLDEHKKNFLDLFIIKTNANEFDLNHLQNCLLEPLASYSLSRKVKEKYKNKPMELSTKAREKFLEYLKNKGELGELLLYCFLESHLNAPKILSKLELKTSTSLYVNGADGVHYLKLSDGNYHLIFGESKSIADLTSAISESFKSIYEFKNEINSKGNSKSGLQYEKHLISDHLEKETFSDKEKEFIERIIYPVRTNTFEVDDAFAIFIGYEIKIAHEMQRLSQSEFRKAVKTQITNEINEKLDHIHKKIEEYDLVGHNFYIYILPFSNLVNSNRIILKSITK